jgi:hypothetical protein
MKKIEVQMNCYTLTKIFIEVQGNILNQFDTHFFTKWCGGLMAKSIYLLITFLLFKNRDLKN